jgi:hypothetical protein
MKPATETGNVLWLPVDRHTNTGSKFSTGYALPTENTEYSCIFLIDAVVSFNTGPSSKLLLLPSQGILQRI